LDHRADLFLPDFLVGVYQLQNRPRRGELLNSRSATPRRKTTPNMTQNYELLEIRHPGDHIHLRDTVLPDRWCLVRPMPWRSTRRHTKDILMWDAVDQDVACGCSAFNLDDVPDEKHAGDL
jgi:hypothetical protein